MRDMEFKTDEILQIAGMIWDTTLGLQIDTGFSAAGAHPRSTVTCVQITGAWNGAILLDCPVEVARLAASIMFNMPLDAVGLAELQDAVAELVNMIGGNIKALLPEKCYLSLPTVIEGGDYSARVPGSRLVHRVHFGSENHEVVVTLLEKRPQQAEAA
jgi:CheY-specific phosphatase CheX